jgi:predicted enzyme related to lactoylglutathione lyase
MTTPPTPAPGQLAHFAVNADDVDAARRFYAAVFGWRFAPWGPPGFFHVLTGDGERPGPMGALQQRRDLLPDRPTNAFEPTVAVEDVDAVVAAVRAEGGTVLLEKTTIAGVGDLVFFADPSGNVCGAMRYDATAD